ncbi:MAG: winged helix-turn-helix domain-containing protein [Planctomycetota bacterium]|jgi:hypothetical protein
MEWHIFDPQPDYEVPLLHLLAELPNGQGKTREVCRLFGERYRAFIPDAHYAPRGDGKPIWDNNVRWCRQWLKQRGFLDGSTRGVWRITEAGRQWLDENPGATRIPGSPPPPPEKRTKPRPRKKRVALPGINLEMLEQTRQSMTEDQFRDIWGPLYDELLAEERSKAITQITQTDLGRRARAYLDEVHTFLNGQQASTPSAEQLANWILFCYALSLYREASSLFSFIQEQDIDPAIFRWVKRVSALCRTKLPG